jgi:hypothetical protein
VQITDRSAAPWEFHVHQTRLRGLEAGGSIDEIATEIVIRIREGAPLCCHPDPFDGFQVQGSKDIEQFRRVIYCLTVDQPLFDRFFNSRHGYRGAYFDDPFVGVRANYCLLSRVAPALSESTQTYDRGISQTFVKESLTSLSAKTWMAEKGKGEWLICVRQICRVPHIPCRPFHEAPTCSDPAATSRVRLRTILLVVMTCPVWRWVCSAAWKSNPRTLLGS